MLHLTLATNLLTAVGATPHFHRPDFLVAAERDPPGVQVALVPFGEEALRHFLYLERPDHVDVADAELFSVVCECLPSTATPATLMAEPQDYTTGRAPVPQHRPRLRPPGRAPRRGRGVHRPARGQVTRELLGWSELVAVTDLASAPPSRPSSSTTGSWRSARGPLRPLDRLGGVPGRDPGRPELHPGPAGPARLRAPPARPAAGRGHQRPADRAGGRRVRRLHQTVPPACRPRQSTTRRPTGRWTPWPCAADPVDGLGVLAGDRSTTCSADDPGELAGPAFFMVHPSQFLTCWWGGRLEGDDPAPGGRPTPACASAASPAWSGWPSSRSRSAPGRPAPGPPG